MYQYSASTGGFYADDIDYPNLPTDLVLVTDERHAELVGKCIGPDADGNPVEIAPAAPTLEQRVAILLSAVDHMLDQAAKARRWDNIKSAALRAGYPGPYRVEGVAYATWMDEVYAACYALLAQFQAGDIAEPTAEELLAMLPELTLPT